MADCINIEKAVQLVNKRGTTLKEVCELFYQDIEDYQNSREQFYLQELSNEFDENLSSVTDQMSEEIAEKMYQKILKDTRLFSVSYSNKSIDAVLDAMNQKQFKYKRGPQNLLTLLCSLRDLNQHN